MSQHASDTPASATAGAGRPVGRFAPSPTGALHFGSLLVAVGSYCLARRGQGRWLLRMEDLDQPRVVPGAAEQMLRTLEGLGFEWDGEVLWQSRRTQRYQQELERLIALGLVFDCGCTRREVLASAPHAGDEGPVYPGTCRHGLPPGRRARAQRLRVAEQTVCFVDGVHGETAQQLDTAVGDFVLRRADGIFAYQLAVVIDDADSGVNQVVRGADLLASTPRQIYLQSCLGYPPPHYVHLPLAITPAGAKISKRDGATPLDAAHGGLWIAAALRFLGQLLPVEAERMPAAELLHWAAAHFELCRVPGGAAVPPAGLL